MAKPLKAWDQYAQESRREDLELPIGPDETLTIAMPSDGAILRIAEAMKKDDIDAILDGLFGDNAKRIMELADSSPAGTLNRVVEDVLDGFGLKLGNLTASPRLSR